MKKALLFALTCTCLLKFYAFAEITVEKDNCKYTVTADCEAGETVTMLISKKDSALDDSDIMAVREGKSEGNKITFTFELEEAAEYEGKYTVYIMNNSSGAQTKKDLTHATDSSISAAENALKAVTDAEELKELIRPDSAHRNALEAMGLSCALYDSLPESEKQKALAMFIDGKSGSGDLIKLMNYSLGAVMISSGEDTETALICAMPEFEGLAYEKAEDELKKWIKDKIRGKYGSAEEFTERYSELCILYKFNGARFSDFAELFGAYAEALNIDDKTVYKNYKALSGGKKASVGDALVDSLAKAPADSTASLLSAFEKAYSTAAGEEGGNSSSYGNGGRKASSGGAGSSLVVSGAKTESASKEPQKNAEKYSDTESVPWAAAAIERLTEKGIVSGDGNGKFRPDDFVTREEFTKMLVMATGVLDGRAASGFTDVKEDAWYYIYISSAYEAGIVTGISETEFGTGRRITRQEMAVMAARTLKTYREMPETREAPVFSDGDEIADPAKDDIMTLYRKGIMSGTGGERFEPLGYATRAQAATVVYNLVK